ncbi:MlaC/ttg2D family ABC transporter substrate-binding protein [Silvimonas iriomotensis]|uniref:Toluene tolerance family protein n=1 Tax=Silvimonas iriomotensis TaxID=449662 RepID=A0ABQ2PAT4_9NEIS|nr:ABC transporter substrate-binding protein [Silvimonas iriomotensis]GGP22646.1 toluene tolerance family protein [Silvimonas iriomotensis]
MTRITHWFMAALLCLPVLALAVPADPASPEAIVRGVSKDVLEIINANVQDPVKQQTMADARLVPLADFGRMTALAVGKYWRTATPEQQQALTTEFRAMLVRTWVAVLSNHKGAQVDVKGTRPGETAQEQTVHSVVNQPGQQAIALDLDFENTAAGWKVYDISIEGISFINSHRNQFGSVIQKDGVDGLIKQLSAANAKAGVRTATK